MDLKDNNNVKIIDNLSTFSNEDNKEGKTSTNRYKAS